MSTGAIPKLSGDIRPLIPTLGLRNYWYPAIADTKVGARKPVKVSMLGEEICLFRGATGGVVAIQDVCPHRGARPSEGACHYRGTVACPYHGWVFDESGKNVAVLSEGPDSGVCGKPGTEAHVYPTRTLKGLVFVWIGDGEPAPIEEDVPEEFFDDALVQVGQVDWKCNWEVALENSMDSHVNYVHRNALVVARAGFIARGAQGEHPIFVGNGFGGDVAESNYLRRSPAQDLYANGWRWPTSNRRRYWTWLFRPFVERARRHIPPPRSARWCGGHHLPGMFRGRVRVRPLHADVRAGRSEADARVVLPLSSAEQRARARVAARALCPPASLDRRVQLLAAGRARDAEPAVRHAREALGDGRRGDPVAPPGRHQALRRARRVVRVPQSRRAGARRGAAQPRLRALPAGGAAGEGATLKLAGQNAHGTGTSPNIGGGIAQGLADEGATVVCVDVVADNATQCAAWIERRGGQALGVTCDVTDEAQVQAMVTRVRDVYGRVDVLVNNA